MPSFVFFSDKEAARFKQEKGMELECVVPAGFDGVRGEMESQHSLLRWHCGELTPVEIHQSGGGGFAFLMGEAIAEDSDRYLTAQEVFEWVKSDGGAAAIKLSRFSGFFAWVVVLDDESIHCGSDPFGFFPVYYYQAKGSFGIATSLKALHPMPDYDRSIDPIGLSRYMLENGCSSHRTVEKSGQRLNIAESISYHPVLGKFQKTQHPFPGQNAVKTIHSLADAIELSNEASRKMVKRHIQRPVSSCMLSGGLDSRQLVSITRELGQSPICVTFGEHNSDDALCAKKTTKKLGLKWRRCDFFDESPQTALENEYHLLSLAGGINGASHWWGKREPIKGTRCLKGLYLDVLYAPFSQVYEDIPYGSFRFAQKTWLHNFGVPPEALADYYKDQEFVDSVQAAISEARAEWDTFSEDPHERQWHMISRYRARSHHGGILWKNSFDNWPVLPALDVPFTEAIRSIDGELMRDRKLQKEAFIAMRPDLAAIPFAAVKSTPQPFIHTKRNWYEGKMYRLKKNARRFGRKYLNQKEVVDEAKRGCWREAKNRTLRYLDHGGELFDTEKIKEDISDLYVIGDKVQWNRKIYSQRMLVGAIAWLASRDTEF